MLNEDDLPPLCLRHVLLYFGAAVWVESQQYFLNPPSQQRVGFVFSATFQSE
jgi:hypothetical protein